MVIAETGEGQSDQIARPKRVAGKTFATETTPFTKESRQFGEVVLRKDHDTGLDLTPKERLDFIRACFKYAILAGRIDILKGQLSELEKEIRKATDTHKGLRGIESERLDVSVTDVSDLSITPDPKLVRDASGSAFPQFGTEQVIATFTIPEDVQPSGEAITAERAEEFISLGLRFMGVSNETVETNLKTIRKMDVTDREALFEAVNKGLIPMEALGAKPGKKIHVNSLHPVRTQKSKRQRPQ